MRLKWHADVLNGYAFKSEEFAEEGIPIVRQSNLKSGKIVHDGQCYPSDLVPKKFMLKERDICIGLSGSVENFGVVGETVLPCALNQRVGALRAIRGKASSRFIGYLVQSKLFKHHIASNLPSTTIVNIDTGLVGNAPIPDVDLATQRQIADFLDRETARIDLLIEKKQRLVALLGERQKVLVEELLEGVDTSHFHRLKFSIHRIEQGWSPQCEDSQVEEERWGVLKLGAITTGVYLEEQHKALPESIEPIPSLRARVGDVLVARASGSPKLVGKAAFVESSNLNLMLSDKHFRLVPNLRKVLPEYLAVVVNSGKSRNQIEDRLSSAEGMARNIGQSVIYGLRCPFPPIDAQQKIICEVRSSRTNTDALVSRSVASIDRLKEYRSALITAAVTGQIDVTTYAKSATPDRQLDAIQEEMET